MIFFGNSRKTANVCIFYLCMLYCVACVFACLFFRLRSWYTSRHWSPELLMGYMTLLTASLETSISRRQW